MALDAEIEAQINAFVENGKCLHYPARVLNGSNGHLSGE
jgi:hypothetical protein